MLSNYYNKICYSIYDNGSEIKLRCNITHDQLSDKNSYKYVTIHPIICKNNNCYLSKCVEGGEYCKFDYECCSNICYRVPLPPYYSFCRKNGGL